MVRVQSEDFSLLKRLSASNLLHSAMTGSIALCWVIPDVHSHVTVCTS